VFADAACNMHVQYYKIKLETFLKIVKHGEITTKLQFIGAAEEPENSRK